MKLTLTARAFITLMIVLGLCVFGNALANAGSVNAVRLAAYLLAACLAARLKVKLPGVTGTMSVNLPFILIAAVDISMVEALVVACLSNLVQCLPRANQKFNLMRTTFNVCNMAVAVETTRLIYGSPAIAGWMASPSLRLAVAAAGFFLVNTVPVAIVIFLTEGRRVFATWLEISQLTFPYFLASAGVAAAVLTVIAHIGWLVPAMILPVMLAFYYSYRKIFSPTTTSGFESQGKRASPQGLAEKQDRVMA